MVQLFDLHGILLIGGVVLSIEDESRDQYGGPSTGSGSCARSPRGRRQKVAGALR